MKTLNDSVMGAESDGQVIYLHKVQVFWHTKLAKKLISHIKGTEESPIQFVSRAKDTLAMNKSEAVLSSLKDAVVGGKAVHNFRVIKIYESKPISRSFYHKEKDYDAEFK
jgi:hypothetical protein